VLRKLKSEFDFTLTHRGFQIHPEWPAEGMPAERFRPNMDRSTRQALWERISAMGADAGVVMKAPKTLANSLLALEAGEFATDAGAGEAFEDRIFRAYFAEGRNIGDRATLLDLAAEAGVDSAALSKALGSDEYAVRIRDHASAASRLGISGVPTLFVGDWPLVGAQSEDVMRRVLERARERAAGSK
jgi:predicted DsbA family dithiol-disulfide isomerase